MPASSLSLTCLRHVTKTISKGFRRRVVHVATWSGEMLPNLQENLRMTCYQNVVKIFVSRCVTCLRLLVTKPSFSCDLKYWLCQFSISSARLCISSPCCEKQVFGIFCVCSLLSLLYILLMCKNNLYPTSSYL